MSDRAQLSAMTTKDLSHYWNILTMGTRMVAVRDERKTQHPQIVKSILNSRGVYPEGGKLLKRDPATFQHSVVRSRQ